MQNELCHYCDLPAFKSIIEKREIWLSDIHFLNDSSEESLFLDALTDLMIKLRDSLSDSTKAYLDQDTFMNSFFTNIKYNYKNKLYICCFTNEKNDDLSQWRGYADDGAGFCIGFKKELINKLSENTTIEKHTLKDDGSLQKERISTSYVFSQKDITYSDKKDIIKELEGKIIPIVKEYDVSDKKTKVPPFPDSVFTLELYKKTYNYKAFYKNKSFESENEYRICFYDKLHEAALDESNDSLIRNMQATYEFNDKITLSELKYRNSRGLLIPFREMTFPKDYFFKMISSITIGPRNRMSIEDVKYFLIANGLDTSKINIMKSESTYQ